MKNLNIDDYENNSIKLLNEVAEKIKLGDLNFAYDPNCINAVNDLALYIININSSKLTLTTNQGIILELLLSISNMLYNNTTMAIPLIDDGIYDMLVEIDKVYNPSNYQVGSNITDIVICNENIDDSKDNMVPLFIRLPDGYEDNQLFEDCFLKRPKVVLEDFIENNDDNIDQNISKRIKNTAHKYPKLVGTLDKCKFVLTNDAKQHGVENSSVIMIFERDFLGNHLNSGILGNGDDIILDAELKYDGVSIEAEICGDRIVSAYSRGDTNNNLASDYTPIFSGYRFKHAKDIAPDTVFGMKFEAVISYNNLNLLNQNRTHPYKNGRNAVIGILGSTDARKLRNYITLVPLETSFDMDRLSELEFMNRYYHSGEYLRHAIIRGNYYSVLFQVNKFVKEANQLRDFLPIMYDGVVISYVDPGIRKILGRKNSVNKYSIAIKFDPMVKQTRFLGYTFSVGKDGTVTPLIHYKPVEFLGGIHTKSSGHSYKRFKDLQLRKGDIVNVEYTNDVMPYCTKANVVDNFNNINPVEEFPILCPECGSGLVYANSGNSVMCINLECPGRKIARIADMIKKLGFKDFSEESLKTIGVYSFNQLYHINPSILTQLGPIKSEKFMKQIEKILYNTKWMDYKIIGALGFSDMAEAKWKLLLKYIPLEDIIGKPDQIIRSEILGIKGLGSATANIICSERLYFMEDLILISKMGNVTRSYGNEDKERMSIRFSGFRDENLAKYLTELGFDVDLDGGVTKSTFILLVPNETYTSTKVKKALANGYTKIMTANKLLAYIDNGMINITN